MARMVRDLANSKKVIVFEGPEFLGFSSMYHLSIWDMQRTGK